MDEIFIVQTNSELGRHGVTKKSVRAGQVVIDEIPFAYGPKDDTPIVCLGCCHAVSYEANDNRCPKCSWPLCKKCWNSELHEPECKVFRDNKASFGAGIDSKKACPQLDCVTPLRMLLQKESDPDRWNREIEPMEYHNSARRECKEIWNADLNNIARYLRGPCKLARFSENLIMRVIGILQVNAFEARTPDGYPIRCLFPQTAILAHNCVPNTTRTIYPSEGYRIKLRALVDVKQDEQLLVSYTYTLTGTAERQAHLKSGKYFTCKCKRCSDPTELETHFSSLKCRNCDTGFVIITDPFDNTSPWKCSNCECVATSTTIDEILSPIRTEIETVEAMNFDSNRLEHTERLYRKYETTLHPLHYMQTSLRQSLIEMYGRVNGYELTNLSTTQLEHKVELCRLVLKILNIFEPGLSRSRAITLYELHAPLVLIARISHANGTTENDEHRIKLGEASGVLEESVRILGNEDPTSQEGLLAAIARQRLDQLRAYIKEID